MKRNRVIISNFGSYFRAPNTFGYKYKNISQNIAFPPIKWIYIHCNIVGTYEFSSFASKYSNYHSYIMHICSDNNFSIIDQLFLFFKTLNYEVFATYYDTFLNGWYILSLFDVILV